MGQSQFLSDKDIAECFISNTASAHTEIGRNSTPPLCWACLSAASGLTSRLLVTAKEKTRSVMSITPSWRRGTKQGAGGGSIIADEACQEDETAQDTRATRA
ncbi:uncharacterized protein [Triticum aestivum]|uniref:uncharacterized protein n=1 Tax=Triticum aestivum TaxID=4565 RepID=UPI001D03518C|nr:uncharacterized protein LOC123165893 [Triticum aestivum]